MHGRNIIIVLNRSACTAQHNTHTRPRPIPNISAAKVIILFCVSGKINLLTKFEREMGTWRGSHNIVCSFHAFHLGYAAHVNCKRIRHRNARKRSCALYFKVSGHYARAIKFLNGQAAHDATRHMFG